MKRFSKSHDIGVCPRLQRDGEVWWGKEATSPYEAQHPQLGCGEEACMAVQ